MENEQMKTIITKDGKKKLELELKNLVEVERPQVIIEIKEARSQGDLSENAEYDAARERQGKTEDRIREINRILENSQVLSINHSSNSKTKSTTEKVKIGSEVVIEHINDQKTKKYQIVGTLEANPFAEPIAKISNESPLAKAIINRLKNDVVTVEGIKKYEVKIIEIKN